MTKTKLIGYTALAIIMFVLGSMLATKIKDLFNEKDRLHEELIGQKEAYVQLSEHAAKLEIQYADQQKLREELEKQFAAEKGALTGRIKVLSNATFLIREAARKTNNSDITYQGDKFKYLVNEIRYNDGPPVGYVLIFDDGRVVSKIYNHEINVKTAIARDEASGRYDIVSKADYILKSPSINLNGEKNWVNKPYSLKISGGQAYVDPSEPNQLKSKFYLWAPHLNANIDFASKTPAPGLGISTMGYGKTKNDLDFRFLQVGAHYSEEYGFEPTLVPVLWRPFDSVLSNTYLGPGIMMRGSSVGYFLGIQVGL